MNLFRYEYDGQGIFSAFENNKSSSVMPPDQEFGLWLKHCLDLPSDAVSFFKYAGLQKYNNEGLKCQHLQCLPKNAEVNFLIAKRPKDVLFEDEFQVVCRERDVVLVRKAQVTYWGDALPRKREFAHRPPFIGHVDQFRDWSSYKYFSEEECTPLRALLSHNLGARKVGLVHEIIQPNRRSDWPHAHEQKEEFVFIAKGYPYFWLNGELIQAKPGDVLFPPPGKSVFHDILNLTQENVEILIAWNRQVRDRYCFLQHDVRNQELKAADMFWRVSNETHCSEVAVRLSALSVAGSSVRSNSPFVVNYESLSDGSNSIAIDDFFKSLKLLFKVNTIPPEKSHEFTIKRERLFYCLKGSAHLVRAGEAFLLTEGDCFWLEPGAPEVIHLQNRGTSTAVFLMFGHR